MKFSEFFKSHLTFFQKMQWNNFLNPFFGFVQHRKDMVCFWIKIVYLVHFFFFFNFPTFYLMRMTLVFLWFEICIWVYFDFFFCIISVEINRLYKILRCIVVQLLLNYWRWVIITVFLISHFRFWMSLSQIECNEDSLSIYLCVPKKYTRRICIKKNQKINTLQKRFPNDPKKFIFNGQYLGEEFTFNFYGINNHDIIVAVPDNCGFDLSNSNWIHASRDSDDIADRISFSMNSKTRPEASRLRDLKFMSIERKPRIYRKMCGAVERSADEFPKVFSNTIIDYTYTDSPSVQALPVCWNEKEIIDHNWCFCYVNFHSLKLFIYVSMVNSGNSELILFAFLSVSYQITEFTP